MDGPGLPFVLQALLQQSGGGGSGGEAPALDGSISSKFFLKNLDKLELTNCRSCPPFSTKRADCTLYADTDCDYQCQPVEFNPEESARKYSSIHGNNAIGTGHARGMLDSDQAWSSGPNRVGEWGQLDLGKSMVVYSVVIQPRHSSGQRVTKFTVQISENGQSWEDVDEGKTFDGNSPSDPWHLRRVVDFENPVSARFVKVIVAERHHFSSMRFGVRACAPFAPGTVGESKFDVGNRHINVQSGWIPLGSRDGGRWGAMSFGSTDPSTGINVFLDATQVYIRGNYNSVTGGPEVGLSNLLRSSMLCNSACTIKMTISGLKPHADVEVTTYHHTTQTTAAIVNIAWKGEPTVTLQQQNSNRRAPNPVTKHTKTHTADENGQLECTFTRSGGGHMDINGVIVKGVIA